MRPPLKSVFLALWACAAAAHAVQLGDLPGEDISGSEDVLRRSEDKVKTRAAAPARGGNWIAPAIDVQLSRDRTLIPLGKGALFVPAYTEPRREPEVALYNARGREIQSGQTGERILMDSGTYTVRFGSGTTGQKIRVEVVIEEGHTTVVPPAWGALIVETRNQDGEYIDGQYELIRMEKWINYGKGHGRTEERLQDIKAWIVPPGLYRISKPGESFASLRNYITVQINAGEFTPVELIFDNKADGSIVSGGLKALNTRARVGKNWTYGLRAGGNVNLSRENTDADIRKEALQVSSDLRLRAIFDNTLYLGTTELFLQDNFAKERRKPFSVTSDISQARSNWVRRLTPWLGPYIRGIVDTHLFPRFAEEDTIYITLDVPDAGRAGGVRTDTLATDTSGRFEAAPKLDPIQFGEGIGVNVEFISKYYLEVSTQLGLAARQFVAQESYVAQQNRKYVREVSLYEIGLENTLNATLRLGNQVTLDLRTEIFAPNGNVANFRLDDLTADFRFFLSQNLEIGYIYNLKEKQGKAANRFPSSHNLSLRLSFNY